MLKTSNKIYIILMSLLIVGTSIGGGILALPLQTGLSGFSPSVYCFILICFTMTVSGWILFLRFDKNKGTVNNIAMLYHHELGSWAKHINTISYFLTFYGLLVAYLSGATSTILSIIPSLQGIPAIHGIITVLYFLLTTSLIVFGKKILSRSNTLLSILLILFFIILITLTISYIKPSNLKYCNWLEAPFTLPILATAFGYHPIIPVIYSHCEDKNFKLKNYFQILLIGIFIVFSFNLIWSFVVMGILPLTSENGISIISALAQGTPATIPISKYISSNTLLIISILFTFFAITTSYIGVGAGLLNYNEGLLSYCVKYSKIISVSVTFIVPLLIALIYPGIFIKLLGLVGGSGVIISCGILPVCLGLKNDNPTYIKLLSLLIILICLTVFGIEICSIFK